MKKFARFSVLMIAAAFVFATCDGPGAPKDNPQTGEMAAATANKIFGYEDVTGGVEICNRAGTRSANLSLTRLKKSISSRWRI